MDSSVDLSVALDTLNAQIADLNIKIVNGDNSEEVQKKLDKCLKAKQEILGGNMLLIQEVIDGNI